MEGKLDILGKSYTKITIVKEEHEEVVAEITNDKVIPATGYVVKLTPNYE